MELFLMIALPAFLAGLVQGVTGFGAGIIMMIVFPYLFGVALSAALAVAIAIVLCVALVFKYRAHINLKEIVLPAVLYAAASSIAIIFSSEVDQVMMKGVLGVFLIAIAVYFLFFGKNTQVRLTWVISLVFILLSGVFDGLFGIGGPLMVIYFLAITKSKEAYLGTIQMFFLVVGVYATAFRLYNGILRLEHWQYILTGIGGILAGVVVANRIVYRIDTGMVRKLTYVIIGLSGVYNVLVAVL